MGIIKQLKQFITGTNIFPITKTNAVYDNTFGRLDKFLRNTLVESDVLEGETEDTPRDADRLGGQLPEYFAKQSDLNELSSNLGGNYLSEEHEVGTWIDGVTKVYEKTLIGNMTFNGSTHEAFVDVPLVASKMISIVGSLTISNQDWVFGVTQQNKGSFYFTSVAVFTPSSNLLSLSAYASLINSALDASYALTVRYLK